MCGSSIGLTDHENLTCTGQVPSCWIGLGLKTSDLRSQLGKTGHFSWQNLCPFWVILPPVNPLENYSYIPPYISPTISPLLPHYQNQYRNNQLPHPYSLSWYYQQNLYRNNQFTHPYSLSWYYHSEMGKGSLIDFTGFRVKACNHNILIVQCLL